MKNRDNIDNIEKLRVRKNAMDIKRDIDDALTSNYDFTQKRNELNKIFDLNMKTILAMCIFCGAATFNTIIPGTMGLTGLYNVLAHIGITAVTVGVGALVYKGFRDEAIEEVFGSKMNYKIAKNEYEMRRDFAEEKIDELIETVCKTNDEKLYKDCQEYLTEDNMYYRPLERDYTYNSRQKAKIRTLTRNNKPRKK